MGKARGYLELLRAMVCRWRARRAAPIYQRLAPSFHENRSPTLLIAFIRPSATLLIVREACPTLFSNGAPFLPQRIADRVFFSASGGEEEKEEEEEENFRLSTRRIEGASSRLGNNAFHSGLRRLGRFQIKQRPRQFCITRRGSLSSRCLAS